MIKKLVESSKVMYIEKSKGGKVFDEEGELTPFYTVVAVTIMIILVLWLGGVEYSDLVN